MAKLLYVSLPLPEHVNPTLGLIKELIKRGEEVVYYSGGNFKERIENTGAVFKEYRQKIEHHEVRHSDAFWKHMKEVAANPNPIQVFYMLALGSFYRTQGLIENNLELFLTEQADYIIHDVAMCYKELPRRLGIPAIASIPIFCIGPSLINTNPAAYIKGVAGMGDTDFLDKYEPNQLLRMLELLNTKFHIATKELNYHLLDAFSGHEDLNLVFAVKDYLLYPESFDESFCFVGACADPDEEKGDLSVHGFDNQSLIYISLSVFNQELYDACIRALEDKPYQIAIIAGDGKQWEQFQTTPEKIVILKSGSNHEFLRRASLCITDGCAANIFKAAEKGTPVLVIPQSGDQFIGAETVAKYKTGICLQATSLTDDAINDAVQILISDPQYRANMVKMGNALRQAGGAVKAADEIFAFKQNRGL